MLIFLADPAVRTVRNGGNPPRMRGRPLLYHVLRGGLGALALDHEKGGDGRPVGGRVHVAVATDSGAEVAGKQPLARRAGHGAHLRHRRPRAQHSHRHGRSGVSRSCLLHGHGGLCRRLSRRRDRPRCARAGVTDVDLAPGGWSRRCSGRDSGRTDGCASTRALSGVRDHCSGLYR